MLKVAIAKGRTAEKVQELLDLTVRYKGIIQNDSRKLLFRDDDREIEFILVKPSDLPLYVENGAVDVGIVGKDILLEGKYSIYELKDLGISCCKMAVAGLPENKDKAYSVIKIATKYPKIAKTFFREKLEHVDIIKLNGSVELAPLLGLSDAIVDIVESGNTLRENGLIVYEEICDISARLIANKISYKLKNEGINSLISALSLDKRQGGVLNDKAYRCICT